jgi:hypothetical protein
MIIPKLKFKIDTIINSLRNYSLYLINEEILLEAIKKDEINAAEISTMIIENETDLERAERLLNIAKSHRLNKDSLTLVQKNIELTASEIVKYIVNHNKKRIIYTLKRNGYKNRRYRFQITGNGKLNVY